jgi:hypothetical protein
MGFKRNYVDEINQILMTKRTEDDSRITLNIPEHKFKKNSEKFNHAVKTVYERYVDEDMKMFHLLLSLQEYFDMEWLVENVLDDDNTKIIKSEMLKEYNIDVNAKPRPVIKVDENPDEIDVDGLDIKVGT